MLLNVFFLVLHCDAFVVIVLSDGPRRKQGRGLLDRKLVKSLPVISLLAVPKAALLFWFFGDFRCGVLLYMVIQVIYRYKNR